VTKSKVSSPETKIRERIAKDLAAEEIAVFKEMKRSGTKYSPEIEEWMKKIVSATFALGISVVRGK